MLAEIGAAVGTFVGLVWLGANTVTAADSLTGTSATAVGLPETGVWVAILGVAVGGTIWLERDGYYRLGVDPTRGSDFAWLAIWYLPLTFLPLGYATTRFVDPSLVVHPYLLACGLLAGWLAFDGGLDRLGVETERLLRTVLLVFAASVVLAVLTSVLPIATTAESMVGSWTTDPRVLGTLALVGQGLVLVVGFTDVIDHG